MAELAPDRSLADQPTARRAVKPKGAANSAAALLAAAVAATLASMCCVLPLLFAIAGISGAWISQLRWFAPYSNVLILTSIGLLGLVALRLFKIAPNVGQACDIGNVECQNTNTAVRRWFWLVVLLTLIPVLVPLLAPMFY